MSVLFVVKNMWGSEGSEFSLLCVVNIYLGG